MNKQLLIHYRKTLYYSIVILFLIPFQLSGSLLLSAFAAQKLPILQLDTLKGKSFQPVVKTVEASGFTPRIIREEDFLFNVTPKTFQYVLVPMDQRLTDTALAMLHRYIAAGGKLILIPPESSLDPSGNHLMELVGLPVTGNVQLPEELPLQWKGLALPSKETLPAGDRIITLQPGMKLNVLATWGNDYPAIVTTSKGALLNWAWGKHLSHTLNTIALAKVVPLAKVDSVIIAQAAVADAPQPRKAMLDPTIQPNPAFQGRKSLIALPATPMANSQTMKPVVEPSMANRPVQATPQPKRAPLPGGDPPPSVPESSFAPALAHMMATLPTLFLTPPPDEATRSAEQSNPTQHPASPKALPESKPVESQKAQAKPAYQALLALQGDEKAKAQANSKTKAASTKASTPNKPAQTAPDEADAEVLNTILGAPVVPEPKSGVNPATTPTTPASSSGAPDGAKPDPTLSDKLSMPGMEDEQTPGSKPAEAKQKRFSFLDPEAAEVLAPEFDYGVYSMNMRILEDYNRRINDGLETGRQLSIDLPKDKIDQLLRDARQHKKKFESLYLGGQTQQGLDEFAKARRLTLQALGLTVASPKVEARAIWLDRGTIVDAGNPAELRKRIQKLHRAGINIIYFETINAGFPIYPSELMKRNPMVQGWDPLQVAIEEGHKLGMEVHAWVWVFAVGNRRHNPIVGMPPDYPGPVLEDKGLMSEALRNRSGGLNVDGRQHEFWLSPASPKAREFLLNVYKEIVTKYDVDGLHLDYIRYPFQTSQNRMGYEPVAREQFYRSTNVSLDNMDDYTAKVWIAWKTYQVSSFVQQVSNSMRQLKPDIKISAAVFPMKRESRIVSINQDWETWIDNGWVDTISPMSYTSDPQRLQGMFDYVQNSPQKHALIYPGIAMHRLDGGQLILQLEALRQKGSLGSTLFAGAHLDADKVESLANGPYKETLTIPPHKDLVKSLQLIVSDYQQKFSTVRSKGLLSAFPAEQLQQIDNAVAQIQQTLKEMAAVQITNHPAPADKVERALQQLSQLQQASDAWSSLDREQNPLRAQYFEKNLFLLNELLGYLADKSNVSTTTALKGTNGKPKMFLPAAATSTKPGNGGIKPGVANNASAAAPAAPTPANATEDDFLPEDVINQ